MTVDDLKKYIALCRRWLDQRAGPLLQAQNPTLLTNWRDELLAAERLLEDKPELPIALLGPSQQGKSSLINAIVGETALPVGASIGACTCVITSVHHSSDKGFRAEIEFISLQDWAAELEDIRAALNAPAVVDDDETDRRERSEAQKLASEKFTAVYRDEPASRISTILEDPNLGLPKDVASAMSTGKPVVIVEEKVLQLRNHIRRYLVGRESHEDGRFWPLISRVKIYGAFDVLSNGVVLVDLPGLNDPNLAREQVTKKYLKDAQYIWLICNSQTGIDRVFSHLLRDEGLLFRLFLEGRIGVFSVITTRVDEMNIEAVLEQMGVALEEYDGDCRPVLAFRRGGIAKHVQKALGSIAEDIAARADPGEHRTAFFDRIAAVSVFSIATAAYLHEIGRMPLYQGMKMSAEETHIPRLIEHLHSITLKESYKTRIEASHRRLQLLHDQASRFFLSRIERIESEDESARKEWLEFVRVAEQGIDEGKREMETVLGRLDESLALRRLAFEEKLVDLQTRAAKNLNAVFAEWNIINWRTLRSAVERNGRWYSSALHREFDLNRDVARAYLDLIPFIWDDFFGAQLAELTDGVARRCQDQLRLSVERVSGAIAMLRSQPDGVLDGMNANLATANESFKLRTDEARAGLAAHIQRTRQELATGMIEAAKAFMQPAYSEAAQDLGGTGTKKRMLQIISDRAHHHGPKLFSTIHTGLAEGVGVLEGTMKSRMKKIVAYGTGVLDQFRHNTLNHHAVQSHQLEAFRAALSELPTLME